MSSTSEHSSTNGPQGPAPVPAELPPLALGKTVWAWPPAAPSVPADDALSRLTPEQRVEARRRMLADGEAHFRLMPDGTIEFDDPA
jgi:hypothetical protein